MFAVFVRRHILLSCGKYFSQCTSQVHPSLQLVISCQEKFHSVIHIIMFNILLQKNELLSQSPCNDSANEKFGRWYSLSIGFVSRCSCYTSKIAGRKLPLNKYLQPRWTLLQECLKCSIIAPFLFCVLMRTAKLISFKL